MEEQKNLKNFIPFLIQAGKLKKINRKGWLLRQIERPESVADHSFRTALMAAFICGDRDLDTSKLIKMALIHDLAEVEVGDITPYDKVLNDQPSGDARKRALEDWPGNDYRNEKSKREKKAVLKIVKELPEVTAKEVVSLWEEMEDGKGPEAEFLRQIDKMEMLLQALEYKKEGLDFPLEPFWRDVSESVKDEGLKEILQNLKDYFSAG